MIPAETTSRVPKALLALALLLFCAAPTPGDIGGCGQAPDILDAPTFFANKKRIDCERCSECGLLSDTCDEACSQSAAPSVAFPTDCVPLVHDGEVCLRALQYASCDDYAAYVDDTSPSVPSECNFCPPR